MSNVNTISNEDELRDTVSQEETILRDLSESQSTDDSSSTYTVSDYLSTSINLPVTKDVLIHICFDREVDPDEPVSEVDIKTLKLCKADLFVWACMGQNRKGSVSDTDNGWTHSDGGWSMDSNDKKLLLQQANAIYEENGEKPVGKTKVKVVSRGIMMADTYYDDTPKSRMIQ